MLWAPVLIIADVAKGAMMSWAECCSATLSSGAKKNVNEKGSSATCSRARFTSFLVSSFAALADASSPVPATDLSKAASAPSRSALSLRFR